MNEKSIGTNMFYIVFQNSWKIATSHKYFNRGEYEQILKVIKPLGIIVDL